VSRNMDEGTPNPLALPTQSERAASRSGAREGDAAYRWELDSLSTSDPIVVTVRTAVPLSEEESRRLARILRTRYRVLLALDRQVDPSVLGGVWIQIGDTVLDGSVAGKLAALREQLARDTTLVCPI